MSMSINRKKKTYTLISIDYHTINIIRHYSSRPLFGAADEAAPWTSAPSVTPEERMFGLGNTRDGLACEI
jgi:hypothetical protein